MSSPLTEEALERFLIASRETAAERRRYAVLQAAATLMGNDANFQNTSTAVDEAEWLLLEIEKRERGGA